MGQNLLNVHFFYIRVHMQTIYMLKEETENAE